MCVCVGDCAGRVEYDCGVGLDCGSQRNAGGRSFTRVRIYGHEGKKASLPEAH